MSVRLENLTVRYGTHVAVDDVSVEFPSGAVGLLGRNGAGKSSILKSLLGLVRPASGRMEVLGQAAHVHPELVRVLVGYMPERETRLPRLNGYETVLLAAELSGMPRAIASRRAHEVLYFAGLDEQRYRPVSTYSTGMKQKVKLAVALVHDPKVVFLDEPTNGLDPRGRTEMLQLISKLVGEFGKSVILSSHILSDVEQVCEHVVLIEAGRMLASGTVEELTAGAARVVDISLRGELDRARAALREVAVAELEELQPGRLRVTVPDDYPVRELYRVVQDAAAAVQGLQFHRRSLEEVFLHAVEGEALAAVARRGAQG